MTVEIDQTGKNQLVTMDRFIRGPVGIRSTPDPDDLRARDGDKPVLEDVAVAVHRDDNAGDQDVAVVS
jgi:hypothetical protein